MPRSFYIATIPLIALACAAPAGAVRRLLVFQSDYRQRVGATVDVALLQQKSDLPLGNITMAVQGGDFDITKKPGTTIGVGTMVARTASTSVFRGATVPFAGPLVAANPADHGDDGVACTGERIHAAVWVWSLAARGQPFVLTVFVDRNRDSLEGRWFLTICPPSPFVAESEGGAPYGGAVRQLGFSLSGMYRNPSTRGVYHWWGIVTPYPPGASTPDETWAVETRAVMPIPSQLSLARVQPARAPEGSVRLAGHMGAFYLRYKGVRFDVYAGTARNRLRFVGRSSKATAGGAFTFTRKLPARTTYYQATLGPVDVTRVPGIFFCGGPSAAQGGCVSATLSEIDSNIVRVSGARSHATARVDASERAAGRLPVELEVGMFHPRAM
jgi:hypothetical protein